MREEKPYKRLLYQAYNSFLDDGKLDAKELNKLLKMALEDGVVDEEEKKVFSTIFKTASTTEVNTETKTLIDEIKKCYGIE